MAGPKYIAITVAMTLIAGALAWAVWEQTQPLLAMFLPNPVRGFIADFRFFVSVLAVFAALGIGQKLVNVLTRRLERED